MPIELEISTASGRAQATASGSIKETRRPLLSGLNLSKSQVESALSRLHSGYRGPLMTVGYQVEIKPISEDIEVINDTPKILSVASDTMRNRSSVSGTYSTTLREDITHHVGVKWSSSEQATKGFEIGGELYIKGSGHMSFTATTGHESSKEKSEVVGSTRGVSVSLRPGEAVRANLVVKRRTAKIRVPFRVTISGHVAAGYGPIEDQPWTIDLKDVLREIGRPTSYTTVGIFEIVCFTDADIETVDL